MTLDEIIDAIGIEPYYVDNAQGETRGVIYCADCMDILPKIPEKAIDLVLTDPLYNIGKDTWDKRRNYVKWLGDVFVGCDRVLKDNASLWFSHMIFSYLAEIHIEITNRTALRHIQFITIDKGLGSIAGRTSENLRTFPRATEYYQFYGYDDPTGAEQLSDKIAAKNPMALYLREEIDRSGVSRKELAKLFPSKTGNLTGCVSNWLLGYNFPLKEQYETLRDYLNGDYLRREYEDLRRIFHLPTGVTDVWQINFTDEKGNGHSTPKPLSLITRIVSSCSDGQSIILDPFLGSGTTAVAAKQLGRKFIGIEIEEKYAAIAVKRLAQEELFS